MAHAPAEPQSHADAPERPDALGTGARRPERLQPRWARASLWRQSRCERGVCLRGVRLSTVLIAHLAAAESRCSRLERQLDVMRRLLATQVSPDTPNARLEETRGF